MRFQLPEKLSFKVPPRKVAQLPDSLFFCRTIPVADGATPAEVATQVELALEAQSPFPAGQLYQGFHWRPGARHACAYAAYRKRFTTEQSAEWSEAEGVFPVFAALLAAKVHGPTTVLWAADHTCTAIVWDDPSDVPSRVVTRTSPTDVEPNPDALREEVLREVGDGRKVIKIEEAPELELSTNTEVFTFKAGALESTYTREDLDLLDVRDKDELTARRRARKRDVLLWRVFAGCVAVLVVCGALELALIGGRFWQDTRKAIVDGQEPYVSKIMTQQHLAERLEERSTRPMRPFEMLSMLAEKKPQSVQFVSATMTGANTMDISAKTPALNDANTYRATVAALEACQNVEIRQQQSRDGMTPFNLIVTFKPGALQPKPKS